MKWPTDGTNITSKFGLRDAPTAGASTNHRGIDIGVSEGTSVYACEAGKVTTASYSESAGNWVIIDHGNGYVSKYMHNSELKVSAGDKVEKGQVIALSGNTGNSTGPHLHFQIEYEGSPVDPLSFKYDNDMGNGTGGVGNDADSSSKNTTKYYAKVATWTEKTTTVQSNDPDVSESNETYYNMTTTNVNYSDMVKGYTMPFDYLWALLVVTEDKDFVLQLADLVYNSKIEITVYDNLEIDTDVTVNTYTKKKKTVTDAKVTVNYNIVSSTLQNSNSVSNSWEDEESQDYRVTETEITKTNTLNVDLTKADVWLLKYNQEYTYEKPDKQTFNNKEVLENQEYPNNPASTSSDDIYGHARDLLETQKDKYETLSSTLVDARIDFVQSKIYNATVNRNREVSNTIETTKYIKSTGKTEEKTDIDSKEDNFVTILAKPECKTARINIQDVSSWLFEILEENQSTTDMVDLTKYLLYKSFNKSYGVTEYDFSEYVNNSFIDISGDYGEWDGTGSQTDFINAVAPYAVADMEKHDIYASVTIAQAILESGWGKDNIAVKYKNFFGMKSTKEHTSGNEYWKGTAVYLNASEGGGDYFRVYDSLKNSIFDHGRNFHVTSTYKKHGVLECISKNLGPKEQLRRIALSGYAVNRDGSIAKPDGSRTYDVYLYQEIIQKYNLEKYDKMTVNDFESAGGNQEIIEIAKSKLGCPYKWGAKGPNAFDCSGLVYWVYAQKNIAVPGSTDGYKQYKNTKKEISWNDAQPGDILIIFDNERSASCGHAGIYLGNDQYIHAPQTGDVVKISTGAKSKFKHVFRFSK